MNNVQIQQPEFPSYAYSFGPGLFNQNMAQAQASGDKRFQMKSLDRGGLSRGGAQQQQATIQGADAIAKGVAQAYGQQTQDDALVAGNALNAQYDQEGMARALAGVNYAQQQNQINPLLGILQGLL